MSFRAGLALFLAAAALFLAANRAAYKGYFSSDDLDNLSVTSYLSHKDFAEALVTPRFLGNNFRPVGHFVYRALGPKFGLNFPAYVGFVHVLHLINVWLVWRLARRLGAGPVAASCGSLFFAFHMAVFTVYWKPMYLFDVLCALFCLSCLLLYLARRYVLSFIAFWLAYKSKELAVMLPAILLLYEWWLGEKRWLRVAPFLLVSLSFGVQAILGSAQTSNDYTLRFTPAAIWKCVAFYSSQLLLAPYAGFLFLAVFFIVKDQRVRFGLATMALFFVPLLFLPGRLYGAYCYVPLIGAATALAAWASRDNIGFSLAAAALWIPWNMHHLRIQRRHALYVAGHHRAWTSGLATYLRSQPAFGTVIYDTLPLEMERWGVIGALRYISGRTDIKVHSIEDREAPGVMQQGPVTLLNWDPLTARLEILARQPGTPDLSFLTMDRHTPIWQLGEGWYRLENRYRWTQPQADARLFRPPDATAFELTVNIGPVHIAEAGRTSVRVSIDGQTIGEAEFTRSGWQTVRWPAPPGTPGPAEIRFTTRPEYHPSNGDPRRLGIPIAAFGFR